MKQSETKTKNRNKKIKILLLFYRRKCLYLRVPPWTTELWKGGI